MAQTLTIRYHHDRLGAKHGQWGQLKKSLAHTRTRLCIIHRRRRLVASSMTFPWVPEVCWARKSATSASIPLCIAMKTSSVFRTGHQEATYLHHRSWNRCAESERPWGNPHIELYLVLLSWFKRGVEQVQFLLWIHPNIYARMSMTIDRITLSSCDSFSGVIYQLAGFLIRFISSRHAHARCSVSIRTGFLLGQSHNQTSTRNWYRVQNYQDCFSDDEDMLCFWGRTSLAVIAYFRRIGVHDDPVGLHMGLHLFLHSGVWSSISRLIGRTARGPWGKRLEYYINAWPNFTMEIHC